MGKQSNGTGKAPKAEAASKAVAPETPTAPKAQDKDLEAFLERAEELKEEGNKLFKARDTKRALVAYEQALKLVPEGHPERLNLHSNRAAAYLALRQYADVVSECSTILLAQPEHPKALARRAKAYEATLQHAKALRDLDALAASKGDAGEDMSSTHERVRALVSDPSLANKPLTATPLLPPRPAPGSAQVVTQAQAQAQARAQQQQQLQQQQQQRMMCVKAQLGTDLRVVLYPADEGLAGLRRAVARKWPEEAVPLVLKAVPLPEMEEEGEGGSGGDALLSDEALTAALSPWSRTGRMPRALLVRPGEKGEAPFDSGLLDEWILDFASLVREHLGVDAEAHLDLNSQGVEAVGCAGADGVTPEAAQPLFATAARRFQEAAACALFNWGNVHMCLARKRMEAPKGPKLEAEGEGAEARPPPPPPPPSPQTVQAVEALLELAQQRFAKALEVNPELHDVRIALAQHRSERARLLAPLPERQADADALFVDSCQRFAEVMQLLPEEAPAQAEAVADAPPLEGDAPPPEPEPSIKAQVLVMWGNVLYEHSQARVRAKRADWQAPLDEAVDKFNAAGCSQADITQALAVHASKAAV